MGSRSEGQVDKGQGGVDAGALGLVGKASGRGAATEGAFAAARGCKWFGALTGGLRREVDCEDGELAAYI